MQGGGSPFDAIVDFTYTVLTATARTVAFSSEQFVKRASKHTLKWLQEFQRDTITIDEIRKKFMEASSWRTYRDQAHELAQRNLAEDKPFSEQMEAQQTRTAFSPLRTQRSAATLPRLTSPARFNRPPRRPQPEAQPAQTFNTGSRPGTAEQELNVRLEQMPLSGDAGQGLSRRTCIDMDAAMEMVNKADLTLEEKLQQIDMAEAAVMDVEPAPPPTEKGWMTAARDGLNELMQAELGMLSTGEIGGLPVDDGEQSSREGFHALKKKLVEDCAARHVHAGEMMKVLQANVTESEQMNLTFHQEMWDPLVQRGAQLATQQQAAAVNRDAASSTPPRLGKTAQKFFESGEIDGEDGSEADAVGQSYSRFVSRTPVSMEESERMRRGLRSPLSKTLPGAAAEWEKLGYRESRLSGQMPTQFEWSSPVYARSPQRRRIGAVGTMLRYSAESTEGADLRSGTPPDEEASLHNQLTFHRGSNTGATQFAALLVANLRPPPATWPQASDSEIGGGCAWLRYLHIVHKEWLKIAIEAKLHVFHLGKGDFCLAGGIPGTGSEVVPPLGSEMAETLAEVALAMRDAKEILGTRRYGSELDEAGHPLPALPPHLKRFNGAPLRIALVLGTAVFRTLGTIPATSEPLHYHMQ